MDRTDTSPAERAETALRRLRQLLAGANGAGAPLQEALAELEQALAEQQARADEARHGGDVLERLYEAQAAVVRFRELFEFAPDGYLITDLAGAIEDANHAATVLFGLQKKLLIGVPLPLFVVPGSRRDFYVWLARQAPPHQGAGFQEVTLQTRHLEPWVAALTVTAVSDAEGRPVGLRWLVRDVTTQKRAAEELRTAKAFAEGLIEAAGAAVLVADAGGAILRVNTQLERLAGYRREELLGRDWTTLLVPEPDRAAARGEAHAVLAGQDGSRVVRRLRACDGRERTLAWSYTRLESVGPAGKALLLVGQDITELEQAQRRALQLERLAAIGQMAAGLAHESRNALQRGQACLERLRWALHDQPHALDLVARARQAQDDLLALYEDVREYAVGIHLDLRPCDVREVWREAWAQLLAVAAGRDARLEEAVTAADLSCAADRFRLLQVFRNLFDNSLAAGADPVWVVVRCADAALDGRPALRVVVCDNGPGLGPEQRARLFEPFYTTRVRGSGLGLAIAKRIVEAHGGRILAADRPPPGAEFVIILPRSPS